MAKQMEPCVDDQFITTLSAAFITSYPKITDEMTLHEIFTALDIASRKNIGWEIAFKRGKVTLQRLLSWMFDQWVLKIATNKSYDTGAATVRKLIETFEHGKCEYGASMYYVIKIGIPSFINFF